MRPTSSCTLDSPSSSTSAIHTATRSTSFRPARAISQQFDETTRPPHPSGRRSSTRRAMRRLSRLFHRVRDQFVAHIPLWSPVGSPPPESMPKSAPGKLNTLENDEERKTSVFEADNVRDENTRVGFFNIFTRNERVFGFILYFRGAIGA